MRFVDDNDLSYCLTISTGIERDTLLAILGQQSALPTPQTFDDFPDEMHQPGRIGLLNVFEVDGFLITLENSGLLGVARRTMRTITTLGVCHYLAVYHDADIAAYQYVEVEDGEVVANFDPLTDEVPAVLAHLFPEITNTRRAIIEAVEQRVGLKVDPDWLIKPTQTYVIDYRVKIFN